MMKTSLLRLILADTCEQHVCALQHARDLQRRRLTVRLLSDSGWQSKVVSPDIDNHSTVPYVNDRDISTRTSQRMRASMSTSAA